MNSTSSSALVLVAVLELALVEELHFLQAGDGAPDLPLDRAPDVGCPHPWHEQRETTKRTVRLEIEEHFRTADPLRAKEREDFPGRRRGTSTVGEQHLDVGTVRGGHGGTYYI